MSFYFRTYKSIITNVQLTNFNTKLQLLCEYVEINFRKPEKLSAIERTFNYNEFVMIQLTTGQFI
jgi:hypothetical protein